MKNQKIIFIGILVFPLVLSGLLSADDVYNFYFQKAPGPQTVIQGGSAPQSQGPQQLPAQSDVQVQQPAQQTQAPSVQAIPQTVAKTEPAAQEQKEDYSTWEFSIGRSFLEHPTFGGVRGMGVYVGLQWNFTRYLGLNAEIMQTDFLNPFPEYSPKNFDGSLALVFTPLRIHLFGLEALEIGGMIGGMSVPSYLVQGSLGWGMPLSSNYGEPDDWRNYIEYNGNHTNLAFYGLRGVIGFTQNLGFVAEVRKAFNGVPAGALVQSTIGLTWKM